MIVDIVRRTCSRLPSNGTINVAKQTATLPSTMSNYLFSANGDHAALRDTLSCLQVREDFVDEREESSLLAELEPHLSHLRYEQTHWDDAIHGYRETEKANWTDSNNRILQRIRDAAFSGDTKQLKYIHVLDISKEGYIKPHVDSIRFCGDTIAGLSLLSSSVMRLIHEVDKDKVVDVLLKRRSLYIMRGDIRYKYTHEILPNDASHFNGEHILRDRRVSIMCRNEPEVADA